MRAGNAWCAEEVCPQECSGGTVVSSNHSDDCPDGSCDCQCDCAPPVTTCPNPTCFRGVWECDSPIVIDWKGEGFHLTSAADGVYFDFSGKGQFQKVAWTDPSYSNAWFALDRNGDGKISDGTELFGNVTPQPPSDHPNGYLALAEYDKPENGGNNNGLIDPGDTIYPKLLLWIDSNHNGISEPQELHHLNELGIGKIDLQYQEKDVTDQYGNIFRYRARVWDLRGYHGSRWTWDVFVQHISQ